jgi:hypothetical protein
VSRYVKKNIFKEGRAGFKAMIDLNNESASR